MSPPPYIGINLAVEGQAIKKTGMIKKQCSTNQTSLSKPKETKSVSSSNKDREASPDSKTDDQKKELTKNYPKCSGKSSKLLSARKAEGQWATGCVVYNGVETKCSVADTYSVFDTNSKKREPSRETQLSLRGPQPMMIPKAILRYTNDKNRRVSTQHVVSIGLSTSSK